MDTKLCYKCKLNKPIDEYYKDPNNTRGLSSKCKVCAKQTFKEYYEKNKIYHNMMCNETITCAECLGQYKKSSKTLHYNTKKHKLKAEKIRKMSTVEGLIKNKDVA